MLGPLDGERVLDAFAGSGALGLEALSRGAASALFVERDARAADVVRSNIADLGLPGERAQVVHAVLIAALRTARERGDAYDLVFLDPPYRLAPALGMELTEVLGPLLAVGARIVTESDRRAPLDLPLPADTRPTLRRHADPNPPGMSTDATISPSARVPTTRSPADTST